MIFYLVSAVVALFCANALGLGPAVFGVGGIVAAGYGFRARRPRWWGFPLTAAGLAEASGALAGWRAQHVAMLCAVIFVVLLAVRLAGHRPAVHAGIHGPRR